MARRLWALDGARLTMDRATLLDGAEPGPVELVVPSFLVQHAAGLVLFDTGLAPDAVDDPVAAYGEIGASISFTAEQRVDRQLAALGFDTADVTDVVLSHVHFDHTGGLPLFPHARCWLGAGDRPAVADPASDDVGRTADLAPATEFDWHFVDGDHDLLGDGSLVILGMPGHTPGNTSLLVRLPARSILLAGDTAHLRAALHTGRPMSADADRDAAAASLRRLTEVAERENADIWVAHDPADWQRFGAPGDIGPA